MMTLSLWQRGRWLLVCSVAAGLLACGGGGGALSTVTNSSTPVVTGVLPKEAFATVATTFTVTGANMPLTAIATVDGGSCAVPTNRSATGFTVVCTTTSISSATNFVAFKVFSDTVANAGWNMLWAALTVSAKPALPGISLLTDTGITDIQCYGLGSDMLVKCSDAAAVALNDKQDGMSGRDIGADINDGWLGFSYSLVGSASECVKDNITGLTWQRGSTTLTALPGDNQNQEANSVSQNANATRLCGYSDWRVPTRDDLQSLVNYGLNDANSGNPSYALDTLFGFLPPNNAWFISGTQYRSGSSANVWVVNFFTGSVNGIGASGGVLELRLVRGY